MATFSLGIVIAAFMLGSILGAFFAALVALSHDYRP